MVRKRGLVFALGLLTVGPCLPDVINVSVNGSINATGTVGYVCGVALLCIGQVTASNSFTLTDTNTVLGIFSRSGATSATDPMFFLTDGLSVLAQQSATVTTVPFDELILNLSNFETPSGALGGGGFLADQLLVRFSKQRHLSRLYSDHRIRGDSEQRQWVRIFC